MDNIKAKILNPDDKTKLFTVALGSGHPFDFANLAKAKAGSSFVDTLNKAFYQKVAAEGEYADWELIGGTVSKPGVYSVDEDIICLNKLMGLIQSNVTVGDDDKVRGTLYYTEGWTEWSGDPSLQKGHYVALYIPFPTGATAVIQKNSGDEKALDSDGILILRLTDNSTADTLKVTVTIDGDSTTRTLTFAELVKL